MASFYVDPVSGNDAYDGKSIGAPFRTVDRSRQAVAAIAPTMSGDITVYLRGGIHRLASTLTFGPTDSGTNGFNVVYCNYANEAPTISGGVAASSARTR